MSLLTDMIEESQLAGQMRPVPVRHAALALIGMANWVAWWYRPEADGDPDEVADALVSTAMGGLLRAEGRRVDEGPLAAVNLLKEDIVHLERLLAADRHVGPNDAPSS